MTIKSMDSCSAKMYMIMGQSMRPRSFLLTLSEFDRDTVGINDEWAAASKPYVIKYRAKITEFEYYTFYEG